MSAATRNRKKQPDPGSQCREWVARATAGDLPRLLLILPPTSGESEAWFGERIAAAARAFGRSIEGFDLLDVDGGSPDFTAETLDGFLASQSLFASRQGLILQRGAKPLQRWGRTIEALGAAAARADGPEWMVVEAGGANATVAKALAKLPGAEVLRFRSLYGDPPPWKPDPDASEAALFARTEAEARGLRLQRGAAGELVAIAGSRPGELVQAIEHLKLLGHDTAGEEEVRAVVAHSAEGTASDFAESVLTGDSAASLRHLSRLRSSGLRTWDGRRLAPRDAFGLLLAAVARERTRTAAVREGVTAGMTIEEALKKAGSRPSVPIVSRMEKRLQRCDEAQLVRVLRALVKAEQHVKMEGWRDAVAALEFLSFQCYRRAAR